MTQFDRYEDMQEDIADLTLYEALEADHHGALISWVVNYWEWVKNPTPGGAHPPHKPPF